MPKVTYIEHDGTEHVVDVDESYSVMEGALRNGIPGIVADCGGACACATCHVFVDPDWVGRTGVPDEMEEAMLEFVEGRQENSRLSCQIKINAALDGLIVRTPETQG